MYVVVDAWFCIGSRDHRIPNVDGKRAAFDCWVLENGRFGNDQRGQHHYRPNKEQSQGAVFLCRLPTEIA
jgi:hypothetical protein